MSSDSTARVVSARNGVVLFPSGMTALPYWNRPMGQRSFFHASRGRQSLSFAPRRSAVDADVAIAVHIAWFHHRGEEHTPAHAASVDGRTADRGDLQQRLLPIEPVNVVAFEGRVGRKVEAILGGNGGDGASLLLALQHGLDPAEIAGGTQDAAFIAVVAGQHPQAIFPGIVNDVVDVTNCALGERVGDAPRCAGVGGRVDVDFIPRGVVKVFSPEYCSTDCPARNGSDVQRARAAEDRVRALELSFARAKRDDRSRNGGDESARRQHRERMETIAKRGAP